LYSSTHRAIRARACALVAKCSSERNSNSSVECQDSMAALSRADPGLPIDGRIPSRSQAARTVPEVLPSLPWSVWKITMATFPPRTAAAIASAP